MKNILIILAFALTLAGCTSSGAFISFNQTNVELGEGNYSLTATGVEGQSEAAYILGLSYSNGVTANTLALARVSGSEKLYADALDDLWQTYESNHGAITDKKLALTNVRYDSDIINLILYTKVTLTVRADIVEFR
ncbi:hypothetical protein G3570_07925 [Balneolaceae bacterium YR4-1]|uniref:Uncharacterized protein n=1 Tax=Halalkalibaculum roseum TaxID=2709311 RepID=A0A6M1SX42_9BACT|nr:DUF6567 family protein [Halalkalibaculum roseum]NGP76556.1 hypothetical protein [Halalkalibaculum roseum]